MALEPSRPVGQRPMGEADPLEAIVEGGGSRQVDLPGRDGGPREMEVCVGQSGECHLVRLELDPFRERVRARLERLSDVEGAIVSRLAADDVRPEIHG